MSLRIGVDCGGTNTDAVILDDSDQVLGWAKRTTTEPDVLAGVQEALTAALRDAGRGPGEVAAVMLGTTHFVNACVQLRGLSRVAVVRLCGPATHSLPPFCDMPPALRQAVGGAYFLADGGYDYDGRSEIAPVHEGQLRGIARRILAAGISCVVVSGVFSPVQASQEQRARAILLDEAGRAAPAGTAGRHGSSSSGCDHFGSGSGSGGTPAGQSGNKSQPQLLVCLSHEVGQLGLLERENAAVLNAALLPLARRVVPACEAALVAAGITAPLLFCSNDGTLLPAAAAVKLPVATFHSGPVNSLRGAALLTGLKHAAVIDIGGTTTDVGLLIDGLPRPAPRVTLLAGAPTNFQMPDVLSIGLGGGSVLRFPSAPCAASSTRTGPSPVSLDAAGCRATVGPDSVGAALEQQALCFGGPTATASDAAVRLSRMSLGSQQAKAAGLSAEQAQAAWLEMQRMLEGALDRAKTEAGDLPVIVVGGGAPLCGDSLSGASAVLRPQHAAVANAVGAAICQVSGAVDAVYDMGSSAASRAAVIEQAQRLAEQRAVAAGARHGSCWVASKEEVPLAYLPGSASRVQVKVIGELDVARLRDSAVASSGAGSSGGSWRQGSEEQAEGLAEKEDTAADSAAASQQPTPPAGQAAGAVGSGSGSGSGAWGSGSGSGSGAWGSVPPATEGWPPLPGRGDELSAAALAAWQPVVGPAGDWLLHEQDLHLIALGAGILGCGGGGSPSKALLKGLMELQRSGPGSMRVVSLPSLPDDALVADCGYMGAPTVSIEKLDSSQAEAAVRASLDAVRAQLAAWAAAGAAVGPSSGAAAAAIAGSQGDRGASGSAPGSVVAAGPEALKLAALMSFEIGGGNGVEPLAVGARMGLPVVDADLMGRAFPEMQMTTAAIYGAPILPTALADEKGNAVVVQRAASPAWLERLLRPLCTEMGCSAGCSDRPLTGQQLKAVAVPRSLSLAWHLGSAVGQAQHAKRDTAHAIAAAGGGRVLFRGKVMDVHRSTTAGFARGQLLLEGSSSGSPSGSCGDGSAGGAGTGDGGSSRAGGAAKRLRIHFQNENLVAEEADAEGECAAGGQWATAHCPAAATAAAAAGKGSGGGSDARVLATAPDLICCIEEETGQPIATEKVRYGLRVAVVVLPAHPLLTTPEALAVVGPAAFGHAEVAYVPLGRYVEPRSMPR